MQRRKQAAYPGHWSAVSTVASVGGLLVGVAGLFAWPEFRGWAFGLANAIPPQINDYILNTLIIVIGVQIGLLIRLDFRRWAFSSYRLAITLLIVGIPLAVFAFHIHSQWIENKQEAEQAKIWTSQIEQGQKSLSVFLDLQKCIMNGNDALQQGNFWVSWKNRAVSWPVTVRKRLESAAIPGTLDAPYFFILCDEQESDQYGRSFNLTLLNAPDGFRKEFTGLKVGDRVRLEGVITTPLSDGANQSTRLTSVKRL